jgi:hypothetical protein
MADGPSPLPSTAPTSSSDDWPAQAADAIERVVGTVRDKTTVQAIKAFRWLVYGTFALLVGTTTAILVAIVLVRLIDSYLPDAWVGEQHTWVAHLIIGALFTVGGMALWRQRRPKRA